MKKFFAAAIVTALAASPTFASIVTVHSTSISSSATYLYGTGVVQPRGASPDAAFSDITNQSSAFLHGGAHTGMLRTKMVADNIQMTVASSEIRQITTTLFNYNPATTSSAVRFRVRFYGMDGPSAGPGTVLGGFDSLANLACPGGGFICQYTFNFNDAPFSLPQSFWAGISFDTGGVGIVDPYGGTASPLGGNYAFAHVPTTAEQLNNLGEGLFSPPSVGSSTDILFMSTGTDLNGFSANNPLGGGIYFGGTPIANTGWEFVPEPGTLGLLAVSGLFLIRRRRCE